MNNCYKELNDVFQKIRSCELSSRQIAEWAYIFGLDNRIDLFEPELYNVLCKLSGMDADDESFLISNDEIIKMLAPFVFRDPLYFLYYPKWPEKSDISFGITFPSLSEDDSLLLTALLSTINNLNSFNSLLTLIESVVHRDSNNELYSDDCYSIIIELNRTTISNHIDTDRVIISTYKLYCIFKDYQSKLIAFPDEWCPDILVEDDLKHITATRVQKLYEQKKHTST